MPNLYPELSAVREVSDTIAYPEPESAQSFGKRYFAFDLTEQPEGESSKKDKRKFVCVEYSAKDKLAVKLVVKQYSHKELKKEFEKANSDRIACLNLYVKDSERKQCVAEADKILANTLDLEDGERIVRIKDHFKKNWKNFKEFFSFLDVKRAFDQHTGGDIKKEADNLLKKYLEVAEKYKTLYEIYGERAKLLKEIMEEMRLKYNDCKEARQHLGTDTVSKLEQDFRLLEAKFSTEICRLEQEDVKIAFIALKEDCKAACSDSKLLITPEISDDHRKLAEEIGCSLDMMERAVQVFGEKELEGFIEKYNGFSDRLAALKTKIDSLQKSQKGDTPAESSINNDQRGEMSRVYYAGIEPLLKKMQEHSSSTSPDKQAMLRDIVTSLREIGRSITDSCSASDIKGGLEKVKAFIDRYHASLNTPRGFFARKATCGILAQELASKLDNLVHLVDSAVVGPTEALQPSV